MEDSTKINKIKRIIKRYYDQKCPFCKTNKEMNDNMVCPDCEWAINGALSYLLQIEKITKEK